MAGRVEEIINNKFYFVLDEVGASDCESELGSENEPKEAADRSLKINLTDKNNSDSTNASNDNNVGNEIKNKNIQHPTISKNNQNCFIEDKASVEKLEEKSNVDTNQMCSHSPQSVTVIDLASEETSTVVDMDIDSEGEYNENEIEPLLRITFRDHSIEKFFKPALTKFFTQKMEDCALVTSNKNKLELEVYEKDSVQLLEDDVVSFDLDTTPTQGSHGEVPHYGKAHNFVLSDKIQKEENNSKLFAAPKLTCFNCLKSHNLKDCKKNKDFRTISRNRIKFQNLMKMAKTRLGDFISFFIPQIVKLHAP